MKSTAGKKKKQQPQKTTNNKTTTTTEKKKKQPRDAPRCWSRTRARRRGPATSRALALTRIHISEPTRRAPKTDEVYCWKKKKTATTENNKQQNNNNDRKEKETTPRRSEMLEPNPRATARTCHQPSAR